MEQMSVPTEGVLHGAGISKQELWRNGSVPPLRGAEVGGSSPPSSASADARWHVSCVAGRLPFPMFGLTPSLFGGSCRRHGALFVGESCKWFWIHLKHVSTKIKENHNLQCIM